MPSKISVVSINPEAPEDSSGELRRPARLWNSALESPEPSLELADHFPIVALNEVP